MTNAQTGTLVLKDAAGNYLLVSQETLEQGRVPEEHKAQIEQLIAEQGDVQGFETNPLEIGHVLTPIAVIAVGAYLIWKDGKKPIGQIVKDYVRTHPQ